MPSTGFYLILVLEIVVELFVVKNVDFINHAGGFITGLIFVYFCHIGRNLEFVDQPTLFEKGLFVILISAYAIGLSYFLLLYYGLI